MRHILKQATTKTKTTCTADNQHASISYVENGKHTQKI